MFELTMGKRISQLFCKHNYYAVAVTDHYQVIYDRVHQKASIYECKNCEHVKIIRKVEQ